jgi:hypothetical protein
MYIMENALLMIYVLKFNSAELSLTTSVRKPLVILLTRRKVGEFFLEKTCAHVLFVRQDLRIIVILSKMSVCTPHNFHNDVIMYRNCALFMLLNLGINGVLVFGLMYLFTV